MVLEAVFDWAAIVITQGGYLGIFFLMALESTTFPLPSEAVLPFAGYLISTGAFSFVPVFIASTLGVLAGSLFSYWLGWQGGHIIERYGHLLLINKNHLAHSTEVFKKHGDIAVFVGRFIPVVRHIISIPAGAAQMNMKKFLFYTALGGGIWNFILIYLGYWLGPRWVLIKEFSKPLDIVALIAVIVVGAYLWVKWKRKKNPEYAMRWESRVRKGFEKS